MINNMIDFLSVMTNYDIEAVALQNILNGKLTQLIGSKNVTFKQYSHSKPTALGYECLTLLNSGTGKDETIRQIDNALMPFLKEKLEKVIDSYKMELQSELYAKAAQLDTKAKREAEKQAEEQLNKIRACNINISDCTMTGIYYEAEQISKTGYGALCIKLTEFGDMVDAAISGDANSKELLGKLKDMADGSIEPKIIAGEVRKNIYGIPVIAIMCCDYGSLLKPKSRAYLENYLSSGIARRAFTYIPTEQKDINKPTSWQEREKAQMKAMEISNHLETVFDSIPYNMVCEFSSGAKSLINEFEMQCIDEFNELYKYDEISAKEVKGSFWKISKLAVVYSVLENPTERLVDRKYIEQAISFYREIQPCLKVLLSKRAPDEVDKLRTFMLQWAKKARKPIKSEEIRKAIDYKSYSWKGFRDEYLPTTLDWLENEHGIIVRPYTGYGGNTKAWQVVK